MEYTYKEFRWETFFGNFFVEDEEGAERITLGHTEAGQIVLNGGLRFLPS
jgi:hypothetical protein